VSLNQGLWVLDKNTADVEEDEGEHSDINRVQAPDRINQLNRNVKKNSHRLENLSHVSPLNISSTPLTLLRPIYNKPTTNSDTNIS